jgi:hypothetical protein
MGEEHGKDQGERRQGLLAAREQREHLRPLPGGWARISRPASSGSSDSISCNSARPPPNRVVNSDPKWPFTVAEGAEQTLATLAVEVGDAVAQPVHGLQHIIALADDAVELALDGLGLLLGPEIDAAQAFPADP